MDIARNTATCRGSVMRAKSCAVEIPDGDPPVPGEVEIGAWSHPLAEFRIKARFRKKGNNAVEVLYVEEWTGPLWPLWMAVEEMGWIARRAWRLALRLVACGILGHRAVTIEERHFTARVCARCRKELAFAWKPRATAKKQDGL